MGQLFSYFNEREDNQKTFVGSHTWKIQSWTSWVNCSINPDLAKLYSKEFIIPVDTVTAQNVPTKWQLMAYPKTIEFPPGSPYYPSRNYLAFKLVCLSPEMVPKGSFRFCTYNKSWLTGEMKNNIRFAPLSLEDAYNYATCIREHPEQDLTIRVKIKIVSVSQEAALPLQRVEPEDSYLPSYEDAINNPHYQIGLPSYEDVSVSQVAALPVHLPSYEDAINNPHYQIGLNSPNGPVLHPANQPQGQLDGSEGQNEPTNASGEDPMQIKPV